MLFGIVLCREVLAFDGLHVQVIDFDDGLPGAGICQLDVVLHTSRWLFLICPSAGKNSGKGGTSGRGLLHTLFHAFR